MGKTGIVGAAILIVLNVGNGLAKQASPTQLAEAIVERRRRRRDGALSGADTTMAGGRTARL